MMNDPGRPQISAHDDELDAARAEFRRRTNEALVALTGLPGLDDTPITGVHSWGLSEDGSTFSVYVDMIDGVTRIYSFTPGQPVTVTDHE
jgi:hypothetical protein